MVASRRQEEEVNQMTLAELQSAHLRLYGRPAINATRKAIQAAVLRGIVQRGESAAAMRRSQSSNNNNASSGSNRADTTRIDLVPVSPLKLSQQEHQRNSLSYSKAHTDYLASQTPDAIEQANRKQRRLQASGVTPHYAQPPTSSSASVASRMLIWASKSLVLNHHHHKPPPTSSSDVLERAFLQLSLCPKVVRRRELFIVDPLKWDPAVAYAESALKATAALKYSLKPHLCAAYVDYNRNSPRRSRNGRKSEDEPPKTEETLALRRYAAVERQQSMWNLTKFVEQGPSYLVSVWRGKFDPVTLQREYNGQYILPTLDYLREQVLDVERKRRKHAVIAKKLTVREGGVLPPTNEGDNDDDDEADPLSDVPTPNGYDEPEPSDSRFSPTLDIQLNPATNTLIVKLHLSEAQIRSLAANADRGGNDEDVAVSGATFLFRSEFVCLTTDVWIGIRGPYKGQVMQFLRRTTTPGNNNTIPMLTTPPIGPALSLPLATSRKLNRQRMAAADPYGGSGGLDDEEDEEGYATASATVGRGTRNYLGILSSHSDVPPVDSVVIGTAADDHSYCFEKLATSQSGNLDDPFKCTECGNLRRANNIVYTGRDGSTLCRGRYFCVFCQANTVHLHIAGGPSDAIKRPWKAAVGQGNLGSSAVLDEAPFRGVSVPKPWVGHPQI